MKSLEEMQKDQLSSISFGVSHPYPNLSPESILLAARSILKDQPDRLLEYEKTFNPENKII
jgi:hypothetical protein